LKRAKIFALSLDYAGRAINEFRAAQSNELFWRNRTNDAFNRMFSDAFVIEENVVGWFLSHGVEYGVYLELANDRQNEAIRPIVALLARSYFDDAREII
jgi:hypothetical protein